MIYPGNHDAIKTLIDSRNGDYNERKFYDCQVSRSGNTTQSLLFTTEYHNKQLETAKQNPDHTCDCAIVYGLMVDCK